MYHLGETTHVINVFHLITSYRFVKFSCEKCKLYDKCKDVKHKQDICAVSKDIHDILGKDVMAHINGFYADCFFINNRYNKMKKLAKIITNRLDKVYLR